MVCSTACIMSSPYVAMSRRCVNSNSVPGQKLDRHDAVQARSQIELHVVFTTKLLDFQEYFLRLLEIHHSRLRMVFTTSAGAMWRT
jgi:hypothetical protein